MKFRKCRFWTIICLALGLTISGPSKGLSEDFNFSEIMGANGMSFMELEMRSTFLLSFCRKGGGDVFKCLMNNGRNLKSNQREIVLAIPSNDLRGGFFGDFEKEALKSIDFENEIKKTPAGLQLSERLTNSIADNIAVKIFYHIERSDTLFSNMLTRERIERQPQTHFGLTVSRDHHALIGLNAYQTETEAFYTLVHEYYHLFDSKINEVNPSPVDEIYQEIRAFLFELRIYAERKRDLPGGKYTNSKFHEAYFVREGNQVSIDVAKVTYDVFNGLLPDRMPGEYVFDSVRGNDFLTESQSGTGTITELESGHPFRDALSSIFDEYLKKSENDRNATSIVARLLYYQPSDKVDVAKLKKRSESIRNLARGNAKNIIAKYGILLDVEREIPFRRDGINNIVNGGPRPRNTGGP